MTRKKADSSQLDRNELVLLGRLGEGVITRTLRSGEPRTMWRLVVRREPGLPGAHARSPVVDTLDCGTWLPEVRAVLDGCVEGDRLEVRGRLHRRFWHSPTGVASRCEVEVLAARRVVRAGRAVPSGEARDREKAVGMVGAGANAAGQPDSPESE